MDKEVALYSRVSTDKQDAENQMFRLRKYAAVRDWKIVAEYTDVISGRKFDRPGLKQLKKDIKLGKVTMVLVWDLSRLGRSVPDLINIIEFFRSHNCGFVSYNDNIDVTTPAGEMTFIIFAAIAQFQRKMIALNTKLAYERKKTHAASLGQKVKWGRKKKILSDEDVVKIGKMRDAGISWREIGSYFEDISFSTLRRMYKNKKF